MSLYCMHSVVFNFIECLEIVRMIVGFASVFVVNNLIGFYGAMVLFKNKITHFHIPHCISPWMIFDMKEPIPLATENRAISFFATRNIFTNSYLVAFPRTKSCLRFSIWECLKYISTNLTFNFRFIRRALFKCILYFSESFWRMLKAFLKSTESITHRFNNILIELPRQAL